MKLNNYDLYKIAPKIYYKPKNLKVGLLRFLKGFLNLKRFFETIFQPYDECDDGLLDEMLE